MRPVALALLLAIAAFAQQRDLGYETSRKVALVVGNGNYPKWPLRNPANDARAVAASLTDLGFETETVLDAGLPALDKAVSRLVAKVKAGDIAAFYYAGHGIQLEGENYLVPVDFAATDEADAKYASYSASRVQERLEKAGARVILVVLDACRNNPFAATRSTSGGLAAMGSGNGTLIAFATAPGKTADDNPGGSNGLFTSHLIQALREPGLSLDQIFNKVRQSVYLDSKGRQVPWTVSSVIGEVYLRPGAANPAPVAEAPVNPLKRLAAPAPVTDVQALHQLASDHYRNERWDPFVSAARDTLQAGGSLQFLFGHHHTLAGIHAASLTVTKDSLHFQPLHGSCNQPAIRVPVKSLQTAQAVRSSMGELFLNLKVTDEKGKQRNFNFTDPDSTVTQNPQSGLPQVLSPAKAAGLTQAVAAVLSQLQSR